MPLQLINCGAADCDATGDVVRTICIKVQQMFAELFQLAGITTAPATSAIIVGPPPGNTLTPGAGTISNVFFPWIIQDFNTLFTALGVPALQQVISMGGEPGMIIGQNSPIIGTGDPSRVAFLKCNSNFTYLYEVL
jgi:hypothetical protein